MTTDSHPDDRDLLAAEYALGLLEGEDLALAERLARQDRAFAAALTGWEVRLATLTEDLEPVSPGSASKLAIMARIAPPTTTGGLLHRLGFWQAISGMSVAAALALAIISYSGAFDPGPANGPLYTAQIVSESGDFRVVAVVDKSANEVILTRTAGSAPPGRILQVWAHGPGAPASSVGLWPEGETVRLPMPPVIAAVEGVLTVGVSEEPPGGSPTGSPTGRVFGTVDIPGVTARF